MIDKVRKHMIFSGRVQGVGFRYRASYAARGLNITGWIQNLWDGTVEMEVQGRECEIDRMLVLLNQDSYIRIDRIDMELIPLKEGEKGFQVKA